MAAVPRASGGGGSLSERSGPGAHLALQHFVQGVQQRFRCERLLDERIGIDDPSRVDGFRIAKAADRDDGDAGNDFAERHHGVMPVHERHDEVRDDNIDLAAALGEAGDGFSAAGRGEHSVAVVLESASHDGENDFLVVDDEDALAVADGQLSWRGGESAGGFGPGQRQVDAEDRAAADLAVHGDEAAVVADDVAGGG